MRGILSGGRFRGTSTITQQLVKNMLLTSERSLARKVRELILAYRLEQEFTKEEILELYLNHINFGHGRYVWVQEAARFYFGKDVSELTLAEAAMLAGIPQSPTHLSPRSHPEAARRRQEFVLAQLEDKREEHWPDLSVADIEAARETPIVLAPLPESRQSAPEIVEMARRTLTELVGEEAARRGGYTVHVTIDADLQRATRAALQEGLRGYDARHDLEPPLQRPRLRRGERPRPLDRVPTLRVGGTYDAMITERDDALGTIGLDIVVRVVRTAPSRRDEVGSVGWRTRSTCWQMLDAASRRAKKEGGIPPHRLADLEGTVAYWLHDFPSLNDRTRSIVVSSFAAKTAGLLRSPLRQLFCSTTGKEAMPERTHQGKVLLVNLPVRLYDELGRFAQVLVKTTWQRATLRRELKPGGDWKAVFFGRTSPSSS